MSAEEQNTETTATENTEASYGKTTISNALKLGVFAIGAALILGLTYSGTKEKRAESLRIAEEKALLKVIGNTSFDNNLLDDSIILSDAQASRLHIAEGSHVRVVRLDGEVKGFILPAIAPDGYSGKIQLLIGVSVNGSLLGVRVVDHKETPGLGDKVDTKKSDWILGFAGKSLTSPERNNWAVKKDGGEFDAFTGATITPRAVVKIVKTALEISETDMQILIEAALEPKLVKPSAKELSSEGTKDG